MCQNKELYVNAVLGTTPSYDAMEVPIINKCGFYTGGFADKWSWNKDALEKLTLKQLKAVYSYTKTWYNKKY